MLVGDGVGEGVLVGVDVGMLVKVGGGGEAVGTGWLDGEEQADRMRIVQMMKIRMRSG